MNDLRQAAQQALEALLVHGTAYQGHLETYLSAIAALRAALAEPQTTHWEGCEAVHPECKNLADYEFKTYKIGGFQLEAGFYSADELRDLIKAFDKMNAATERSMRRMK